MNIRTQLVGRPARTAVAVLAVATLGVSVGATAPATATPAGTHTRSAAPERVAVAHSLRSKATGLCLDDSFAYSLRTTRCNGLNWQKFEFVPTGSFGTYVLRNQATGRCVHDSPSRGISARPCNYSYLNQRWYISPPWGTEPLLRNTATWRCIDNRSFYGWNLLQSLPCDGRLSSQKFYVR
ncbi:RICIN domain-containing protein [Streptomyces sp. NPDC004129]